jgi:uncharacterized protein YndB with AHSA1/START domain
MTAPENVYEIVIAATPERIWDAITDPQQTRQYFHGALNRSDWTVGSRWTSESEDGEVYLDGEILEIDPPRRLVHTFRVVQDPTAALEAPSKVEWQITPLGDTCRLTMTHTGRGPVTMEYTSGGWNSILSGLKELLESGSVVGAAMEAAD